LLAAYETMCDILGSVTEECFDLVVQLVPEILRRLGSTNESATLTMIEKNNKLQKTELLCGILFSVLKNLPLAKTKYFATNIASLMIQVLVKHDPIVCEEALRVVGALASAMDANLFAGQIPKLYPHILRGLRSVEEASVLSTAVGSLSDIIQVVGLKIIPQCDDIMKTLLENLQNTMIGVDIKAKIISCIGDIAFALGDYFSRYIQFVVPILEQAGAIKASNYDEVDMIAELRDSIYEAYTAIVQGMGSGQYGEMLLQYIPNLVRFVEVIYADPATTEAGRKFCYSIVYDLINAYGAKVKPLLPSRLPNMIAECEDSSTASSLKRKMETL